MLTTAVLFLIGCAREGADEPVEWLEPYACGWERGDPGDLVATGAELGDVIADFSAPDQCGEDFRLWDGYGQLTLMLSVPFW